MADRAVADTTAISMLFLQTMRFLCDQFSSVV